eukprot:1183598-Prymnesium_polylepis.1
MSRTDFQLAREAIVAMASASPRSADCVHESNDTSNRKSQVERPAFSIADWSAISASMPPCPIISRLDRPLASPVTLQSMASSSFSLHQPSECSPARS